MDIENDLNKSMSFTKAGQSIKPIFATQINGQYILAAYKGSLSKYDILIKYRQKINNKWSRIRTPKHVHWAVDILLKMYLDKKTTDDFLDFLLGIWESTKPLLNETDRSKTLTIKSLIEKNQKAIKKYDELSKMGEYSITFLILLAKLLMIQEKTNRKDAYMFKKLLNSLKEGDNIFTIISAASFRGR